MRLPSGLFALLVAEALLAVVLPGAVLIWNLTSNSSAYLVAADRQALAGFAALTAGEVRGGTPLPKALRAVQARFAESSRPGDPPAPLHGRVALYTPKGAYIDGAQPDADGTRAERPVMLNGAEVGIVRVVRAPTPDLGNYAFARDQIIGILVAMGVLLLILLVGGWIIARRWTQPQAALYQTSKAVAQGDYEVAFEESGSMEMRGAMRNLGRVARRFERLESARRTWLVSVSEELRQPVAMLSDKLAAVRPRIADEARFEDIAENVKRLQELAGDLNAVALADLGRLPVTFGTVDPVALIHNAIWSMSRRAKAQGVAIEPGNVPQSTVPVKWDGDRIEQLFVALIDSSLRYTPPGGRIALGLEGNRSAWRLIVDDSAPGVDIQLAQQLFEPFYRTGAAAGESVINSGLGLATAQAIVEAHHGRIEASRSPLGGLRVTVILPGAPPTA